MTRLIWAVWEHREERGALQFSTLPFTERGSGGCERSCCHGYLLAASVLVFGEQWLFPLYQTPGREVREKEVKGGRRWGGQSGRGLICQSGNNTRSLRQKTKGLLVGKRATKEQQWGLLWLISPCSSHTPVLMTGLTAVGGCGGVAVDNCFGAALQFRCLQCPCEGANLSVTPHIFSLKPEQYTLQNWYSHCHIFTGSIQDATTEITANLLHLGVKVSHFHLGVSLMS